MSESTTVFHLEMGDRSALQPSASLPNFDSVLVDPPDPDLNQRFYTSVGTPWKWTDRLTWSQDTWQRHTDRPALKTFIGRLNGDEVGYFELEKQEGGNVEIKYLGLLPNSIGKGLGGPLLTAAVTRAWELSGTERVWVHTCTHDHRNALSNYEARGFTLFRTEQES